MPDSRVPTTARTDSQAQARANPFRRTERAQFHGGKSPTQNGEEPRIFAIGGPDNMSRLEVLSAIEEILGQSARRRHVPVAMMRGVKFTRRTFQPGAAAPPGHGNRGIDHAERSELDASHARVDRADHSQRSA
jgi:hypothetical protein